MSCSLCLLSLPLLLEIICVFRKFLKLWGRFSVFFFYVRKTVLVLLDLLPKSEEVALLFWRRRCVIGASRVPSLSFENQLSLPLSGVSFCQVSGSLFFEIGVWGLLRWFIGEIEG